MYKVTLNMLSFIKLSSLCKKGSIMTIPQKAASVSKFSIENEAIVDEKYTFDLKADLVISQKGYNSKLHVMVVTGSGLDRSEILHLTSNTGDGGEEKNVTATFITTISVDAKYLKFKDMRLEMSMTENNDNIDIKKLLNEVIGGIFFSTNLPINLEVQ